MFAENLRNPTVAFISVVPRPRCVRLAATSCGGGCRRHGEHVADSDVLAVVVGALLPGTGYRVPSAPRTCVPLD